MQVGRKCFPVHTQVHHLPAFPIDAGDYKQIGVIGDLVDERLLGVERRRGAKLLRQLDVAIRVSRSQVDDRQSSAPGADKDLASGNCRRTVEPLIHRIEAGTLAFRSPLDSQHFVAVAVDSKASPPSPSVSAISGTWCAGISRHSDRPSPQYAAGFSVETIDSPLGEHQCRFPLALGTPPSPDLAASTVVERIGDSAISDVSWRPCLGHHFHRVLLQRAIRI